MLGDEKDESDYICASFLDVRAHTFIIHNNTIYLHVPTYIRTCISA